MTAPLQLSTEQRRIVDADLSAIVVVAGAGSGKTEVVARRVERLLLDDPGDEFRVLALTYTVKAADELRERFVSRLGSLSRRVDADTIHGFAHRLLRLHGTRVGLPIEPEVLATDDDRYELLTRWLAAQGQSPPPDARDLFSRLDVARARGTTTPLLSEWNAALDDAHAVDYPAMLDKATELLGNSSVRRQMTRQYGHVVVDEAQNLTLAQYRLLKALIGESAAELEVPTMLVGDDKQSIVSFAGADPRLIGTFAAEFDARRFELHHNFRSARRIVEITAAIARDLAVPSVNASGGLDLPAAGRVDVRELVDEDDEAACVGRWVGWLLDSGLPEEVIAPNEGRAVSAADIAILSRTGPALRVVEAALQQLGHPTAMASTPDEWVASPTAKLVLALVAYQVSPTHQSARWTLAKALGCGESLIDNRSDLASVLRNHDDIRVRALEALVELDDPSEFVNTLERVDLVGDDPEEADWEADVDQLRAAWLRYAEDTAVVDWSWGSFRMFLLRMQRGDDLSEGIRLLTVHKAQGREFKAVAVIGCNDGQFPHYRATTSEDQISELRTFYVAASRPSRVLLFTRARRRRTRYGGRQTDPSPFLRYVHR